MFVTPSDQVDPLRLVLVREWVPMLALLYSEALTDKCISKFCFAVERAADSFKLVAQELGRISLSFGRDA